MDNFNLCRNRLVFLRMLARRAIALLTVSLEQKRYLERKKTLLKRDYSITLFLPLEAQIRAEKQAIATGFEQLANIGELVELYLEMWQASGATLKDLCLLCGKNFDKTKKAHPEHEGMSFTKLFFVEAFDVPAYEKCDFLSWEVDCPLTHVIKEHICNTLEKASEVDSQVREQLNNAFEG